MSWVTFPLAAIVAGLIVLGALGAALLLFLRATRGAKGLKTRVDRLFLLPVRVRPLPKGHYFKPYWR
jgi:hypothetical protein